MGNVLRKIALQVALPVLCGLIVVNTYFVAKNLKLIQKNTAQRVEASELQADIANVTLDLQDLETGQRGYLLTGDTAYLQPYTDANARLAGHFASLRDRLATKTPQDRALEAKLESLTEAKIAEMQETIRFRERGYRHRAFLIVSSNRGKELMDEARKTLNALASAQTSNVARYEREISDSVAKAIRESVQASLILLLVTVVIFLFFNRYRSRLEVESARLAEQLRATSLQLEQFTATIFRDFRELVGQMRGYANSLLDVYGGFLPRQGQEKAECIERGAGHMIRLLDELSGNPPTAAPEVRAEEIRPLQSLSA